MKTMYMLDGAGINGEIDLSVELKSEVISDLMSRLIKHNWRFNIKTSQYVGDIWLKTTKSVKEHIETSVNRLQGSSEVAKATSVGRGGSENTISVYAGKRRLFSFFHTCHHKSNKYYLNVDFSPTLAFSGQNSISVSLGNKGHTYDSLRDMLIFPFEVLGLIMGRSVGFFKPDKVLVASIQLATYSQEFESVEERDTVLIDLYNRYCGKLGSSQLKINNCAEMLGLETRNSLSTYVEDEEGVSHLTGFALLKSSGEFKERNSMLGIYAKDWKNREILKSKLEDSLKDENNLGKRSETVESEIKAKMHWDDAVQDKVSKRLRFDFTFFGSYFKPKNLLSGEGKYYPNILMVAERFSTMTFDDLNDMFKTIIINDFGIYKLFGAQISETNSYEFINYREIKKYIKANYPLFWAEYSSLANFVKRGRVSRLATGLAKDKNENFSNASEYLEKFYIQVELATGYNIDPKTGCVPYPIYAVARDNSVEGFKDSAKYVDLLDEMEDGSNRAGDLILDYAKETSKKSRKLAKRFLSELKFAKIPTRVLDGVDLT